ncbi:hypothetical protein SMC26_37800 [Actinomadura fulvescens]|uniref:Thymidylate kinase n=1 Tax=Actinomadura fulvescens TaxID=46160 RepID=A0ABP6DA64_9ACTN
MTAGGRTGAVRIALLGIDGSGKSTLARRLAACPQDAGRRRVVLSSLRAHENPDAPLHGLSRHLDTLSKEADRLGSPDLKLGVLYLQMCTYGVAERLFVRELSARTILTERHPVIDALAYIPLYRPAIERVSGPGRPAALRERLLGLSPAAVEAALAWCEVLSERTGRTVRLDTVATELTGLLDLPVEDRVAALSARFGVTPPDVAVLLDIGVDAALDRLRARGGRPEVHERAELLARAAEGYNEALAALMTLSMTRVHRVRADTAPPAELAARVARLTGL